MAKYTVQTDAPVPRRSPDANWNNPRFALKRLLRRPTAPLDTYAAAPLSADHADRLRAAALSARSEAAGPDVAFVLGTMPRSGTNFLERLLLAHPDVADAPDNLRELPTLSAAREMREFEDMLARFYPPNGDVFAPYEWLAYAMSGYLNAVRGKIGDSAPMVTIKDPHMRHIWLFDAILPMEKALLVVRDGRYLIDSTIRTWPLKRLGRTFEDVCLEWEAATRAALDYADTAPADRVRMVRYEDLVSDTVSQMSAICTWLGQDPARLPSDAVKNAPVLGSSTHSKDQSGTVGWTPVAKTKEFNPTGRSLDWSNSQLATFERVCAATQKRAGYGT